MSDNTTPPQIFLSYSWKNSNIADEIEGGFRRVGILLMRDVRDAKYRCSIKEFMQRVGNSNFVLMIISDEFLRSDNCMYEVTELLNTREFENRIFPILLDNASGIFKSITRQAYYDYWKDEMLEAEKRSREHLTIDFLEEAERNRRIYDDIDSFFRKMKDLNVSTYEILKGQNYKPLFDIIGLNSKQVLEEMLSIFKIDDKDEQELAIEGFIEKYQDNWHAYFLQAYFEAENKQYQKARTNYEKAIEINPKHVDAHYNLALLLEDQFADYAGARTHYEKAIEINPDFADAHNNLAFLLADQFSDYADAREHFEKTIQINPRDADTHYNVAILLADQFSDYEEARAHYEKAIEINPDFANAYYNLALLLENRFSDYIEARAHYKKAIEINPKDAKAHYNLALLLEDQFSDADGAKTHVEKAIQNNPDHAKANSFLSYLLKEYFNEDAKAKKLYLKAIGLDPSLRIDEADRVFKINNN